jgi:tetratricopeptide (TPR) repeat protein
MHSLIIRHLVSGEGPRFQVVRLQDGKSTDPVQVPSPLGFPVDGRPESDLLRELRWYLEVFLDYPFPPETEHAERVQQALRNWGEQAFTALFGDAKGGSLFEGAIRDGQEHLHLQIASDDPRVLGWPWEALRDPQTGVLGQLCQIERRLHQVRDPQPLSDQLPADRVNILLVTARPFEADVQYRSLSRPLVELIARRNLPAQVTVLRPPTLDRLRGHLRERPQFYHLVHFDGHGAYRAEPAGSSHTLRGPQGCLIFEDRDGKPDPVTAEQLSVLLREYRIPAVVLNACQSGMVDHDAEDAFASVAASLLQSGIRSVVAMAYSLYVSGGQEFLPSFYQRLFESGSVAEAVRAGRQQMFAQPDRVCARGQFPLQDWLVPVLYQQEAFDFSFPHKRKAKRGKPKPAPQPAALPAEVHDEENPYGFIGRDGAILELERALRRPPAGILIHGLGGVGKTTLARGFVQWLLATDGLPGGCFWFTFHDDHGSPIRTAEYVFNRLGEALFGTQFIPLAIEDKMEALARVFKDQGYLIVWDNFEVVRGLPAASMEANLSADDQALLLSFLKKLRGGRSKVLITSRSDEEWLGSANCFPLSLGGLQGEERWEYCAIILRDLGLTIDRTDPDLVQLMDLLDGHPLAMRVMLPKLGKHRAAAVVKALQSNLTDLHLDGEAAHAKLFATLRVAEQSLPTDLRPLLTPLALHERFVDADYLEYMTRQVDAGWTRDHVDRFLGALAVAGLLRDRGQSIYEMHPALTGFLRSPGGVTPAGVSGAAWNRAFVDIMGQVANQLAPRELHEQRTGFYRHGTNFYGALREAERLQMHDHFVMLTQALAVYAQNMHNYKTATDLFVRLAESDKARKDGKWEAGAYHQLGIIAQERRDYAAAEQWYRKALAISEKHGIEHGAARTYHHLGIIAAERREFAAAEQWYQKSLTIDEKLGNEHGAARTYHELGRIAQERREFAAAEQWYEKSLAIKEKPGNEYGAASTYHQLGMIAAERRDYAAAERWYCKALAIDEKHGNEHGVASTYHQLGIIAQEQRDLVAAEQWYRKALAIEEKHGNEHHAARTYHQLGTIAAEQRDWAAAEQWHRKALAIDEKLGNEPGVASTYHNLGVIAQEQRNFVAAEHWYRTSLEIAEKLGGEDIAARTYSQLGRIREEAGNPAGALQCYTKAAKSFHRLQDALMLAAVREHLRRTASDQIEQLTEAGKWQELERLSKEGIELCKELSDADLAVMFFTQRARARVAMRSYDLARWDYKKVLSLFEERDDKTTLAEIECELADLEFRSGFFADAEKHFVRAEKHWRMAGDDQRSERVREVLAKVRGYTTPPSEKVTS